MGYCKTEEEFSRYAGQIKSRMEELSQLYDIYYEYSDESNLKTINDNAGIQPVPVREEILDLIEFCQEWYGKILRWGPCYLFGTIIWNATLLTPPMPSCLR